MSKQPSADAHKSAKQPFANARRLKRVHYTVKGNRNWLMTFFSSSRNSGDACCRLDLSSFFPSFPITRKKYRHFILDADIPAAIMFVDDLAHPSSCVEAGRKGAAALLSSFAPTLHTFAFAFIRVHSRFRSFSHTTAQIFRLCAPMCTCVLSGAPLSGK